MSALYSHAIRWEWTTSNPITSVRQSAKRQKIPEILTVDELVKLLTKPYWPNSIFRIYIKPAAKKIGLSKRIGWHTFRHTFGTILNANGENPKVIQELLRHANLKVTMDTYVQAVSDEKRKAQSKVVKMLLPGVRKREAV